jgi:hypothetical protein
MKVGLLVFGQFRSYEEWFESNIVEIQKSLPGTSFDIFILTDKLVSGNYSKEGEDYIRNTLDKYNITVKLFAYWEDQTDYHAIDKDMNNFNKNFLNGVIPSYTNDWMVNLWYRRYILWNMVKLICQYKHYDFFLYSRLFDTEIKMIRPVYELLSTPDYKSTLYTSIDTLFIGSPLVIDTLFQFGGRQTNWKDFVWTDEFIQAMIPFDGNPSLIATRQHTMCSESQIFYYIYNTFTSKSNSYPKYNIMNLRYTYFYVQIHRCIPDKKIPKRIAQIALGDSYINSLPLFRIKYNIMKNNPEYSYELITDKEALELLDMFPQYKNLYHSIYRPQYKSDIIRYLYLYMHGGWYIDIDLLPVFPLDTIYNMSSGSTLLCVEGAHTNEDVKEMANGFLASRENNRVFLDLIDQMVQDPNPEDYGMNVKRCYSYIRTSAPLFTNENGTFVLKEQPVDGKYYIYCNNTMVLYSNGHGYPFKEHETQLF